MKKGRKRKLSLSDQLSLKTVIRERVGAYRAFRSRWPTNLELCEMYGLSEPRINEIVREVKDEGLFIGEDGL